MASPSQPGPGSAPQPEITVVTPSHDRPLRLRWLLNALEEQTLAPERFEVVVVHDSTGPETEELLSTHPLARAGVLRHLRLDSIPRRSPAELRNAGWRAARAPLIAFTDDDCRPPAEWLERALAAARRCPGAIVQGATDPDPDEAALTIAAAFHRSLRVQPPTREAPTCNILYPRSLLEALNGFDERLPQAFGEDTELALRAKRSGSLYVGAPSMRTHHMVDPSGLWRRLRSVWRWRYIPYVVKLHPQLRRECAFGLFWSGSHAWFLLALAGVALTLVHPAFALLALGWLAVSMPSYGPSLRGRLRSLAELPGKALIEGTELAACLTGSVRYRTLVL